MGNRIFGVLHRIASTALNAGITLDRWSIVTTTMIEKDPGRPHINRLRVIHLYEANYNLLLKILWARRLTLNAHQGKALRIAQAGSCPGRRAIDTVCQENSKLSGYFPKIIRYSDQRYVKLKLSIYLPHLLDVYRTS